MAIFPQNKLDRGFSLTIFLLNFVKINPNVGPLPGSPTHTLTHSLPLILSLSFSHTHTSPAPANDIIFSQSLNKRISLASLNYHNNLWNENMFGPLKQCTIKLKKLTDWNNKLGPEVLTTFTRSYTIKISLNCF